MRSRCRRRKKHYLDPAKLGLHGKAILGATKCASSRGKSEENSSPPAWPDLGSELGVWLAVENLF